MARLSITDDGDEKVYMHLDGVHIFTANHEDDGWDGMTRLIALATTLALRLGVGVDNEQGIV